MIKRVELSDSRLLICEGKEEKALVSQFIEEGLVNPIDVLTIEDAADAGGISALRSCILGLPVLTGFANVQAIGFLLDNDSDPDAAFRFLQDSLRLANEDEESGLDGRLALPTKSFSRSSEVQKISISTYFAPGDGVSGCLETIILSVLRSLYPDKMSCIDQLFNCSNIANDNPPWPAQKIHKAMVRAAFSVIYRKNPAVSLTMLWRNDPRIVPATDPAFAPLIGFINGI